MTKNRLVCLRMRGNIESVKRSFHTEYCPDQQKETIRKKELRDCIHVFLHEQIYFMIRFRFKSI